MTSAPPFSAMISVTSKRYVIWKLTGGLAALVCGHALEAGVLPSPGGKTSATVAATTATRPTARGEKEPAAPEVALGERLFLETRFSQFFFARSGGNPNQPLAAGDPVLAVTATTTGTALPGPFAGQAMNCRACHLVGEHANSGLGSVNASAPSSTAATTTSGGTRTYADFARRSPIPVREDGRTVAVRHTPPMVNSFSASPGRTVFVHADGEFTSGRELAMSGFTGRNFGWLPHEHAQAVAHVARIVRDDDGAGELAKKFGGAYGLVLAGTDPAIPAEFRLPPKFRLNVSEVSDADLLGRAGDLVAAYMDSLVFSRDATGAYDGSPYDVFLRQNRLPRQPADGETDRAYSQRLLGLLEARSDWQFVGPEAGTFKTHRQEFAFGKRELAGLKIFLRTPGNRGFAASNARQGGVGSCAACHAAPHFTDGGFHNTGVAQDEYDGIHGRGAFARLSIPSLLERGGRHDAFLPATAAHPRAAGPFNDIPVAHRPGRTDLGLWNVFANPDHPGPQAQLERVLGESTGVATAVELLDRSIARFKTATLRDLGHSAPYLHNGSRDTLANVVRFYQTTSALARAGKLRNAAPELKQIGLAPEDVEPLTAFLHSLNEDYE